MDVEAMEELQSLPTGYSDEVSDVVKPNLNAEGGDDDLLALDDNVDDEEENAEFTYGDEDGSVDDENDNTRGSETSDVEEELTEVVVEEVMTAEHGKAVAAKVYVFLRWGVLFPPLLLGTYCAHLLKVSQPAKLHLEHSSVVCICDMERFQGLQLVTGLVRLSLLTPNHKS